jgi:hypothetical protein
MPGSAGAAGDNKEDLHRNGSVVPKTAVNVGRWLEVARKREATALRVVVCHCLTKPSMTDREYE